MSYNDFTEVKIVNDDTDIRDIIKDIIISEKRGEAFHVLNIGEVLRRHKLWLSKLPRIEPHYALKSNSHPTVIKLLAALGANFDCASKQEIIDVQRYGVAGERIIYSNPVKSLAYIAYAKTIGVDRMTADGEDELLKIKKIFPEAKVVIRIRSDSINAGMPLGFKFGCDPHSQAIKLIDMSKKLGLDLHGFSFHVGSPCGDLSAYSRGIKTCKELIDYARSVGFNDASLIDIGGGIPGEPEFEIDKFVNVINDATKDIDSSVKFISEPGRYYVMESTHSAACIEGKKEVIQNKKTCYMYYMNDGIFGSFSAQMKGKHPIPLEDKNNKETFLSTLWGPTGHPFDYVIKDFLPEFSSGDWILWKNMGAYSLVFVSTFNGFQPPTVYPFIRRNDWKVLQKEIIARNDGKMSKEN